MKVNFPINLLLSTRYRTPTIVQRLLAAKATSTPRRDPCRAATEGFRIATIVSGGPFIETSLGGNKHQTGQANAKSFFRRNPTPALVVIDEDNDPTPEEEQLHIHGTSAFANTTIPATAAPSFNIPGTTTAVPTMSSAPPPSSLLSSSKL